MEVKHGKWNEAQIAVFAHVLKAIAHPWRTSVIAMLSNGESLPAAEIFTRLNTEQALASHHLGILRECGIVKTTRQGKITSYSLKDDVFSNLLNELAKAHSKNENPFADMK